MQVFYKVTSIIHKLRLKYNDNSYLFYFVSNLNKSFTFYLFYLHFFSDLDNYVDLLDLKLNIRNLY